jgi:ribosomal protein L10
MSKQIKQMQMDDLKKTFSDVRDLVVLSMSGLSCQADNQMRLALRKKNIRLQVVKNNLARRVFDELGMRNEKLWDGSTVMAWGAGSLAELSRELDTAFKKNTKVKFKGALAEGQPVTFQQALAMPTRAEAIGQLITTILGPASQVISQIMAPANQIASQIQTLAEKAPAAEAPSAPAAG